MTEVLSYNAHNDGTPPFGSSPIHHSTSQASILAQNPVSYSRHSRSSHRSAEYDIRLPVSAPSSVSSSSPQTPVGFSKASSYLSTPSSSLSLDEQYGAENNDIEFPSYDDGSFYEDIKTVDSPNSLRKRHHSTSSITKKLTPNNTPRPGSPPIPQVAGDDTAIRTEPSRHVDYLSHNWKVEDVSSSWRLIVGKRNVYGRMSRLENASWRSWAKAKFHLKTVSPETLNWLKDHDVTWLYGPLQTATTKFLGPNSAPLEVQSSRCNSCACKPILKKRSLSEIMLQRSISTSTLIKQATDALHVQQHEKQLGDRPMLGLQPLVPPLSSSNSTSPIPGDLTESSTSLPSVSPSGPQSPCERRHIHFNDKVEQCIAINKDGDDHDDYFSAIHDEELSDDEVVMMKPTKSKKRRSTQSTPRNSFSNDSKTIAMLPSTTLKYRSDTPEHEKQQAKQKGGFWTTPSTKLSASPSQETLRPSKPFTNFLLDDEDEDDLTWQPTGNPPVPKDSVHTIPDNSSTIRNDNVEERTGLRRTASGMFMPYEEDEDDIVAAGLFGRVVDTVNTAKDIAHVIWNVGWRS